ncbi:hypothetical protein [Actinoplanes sp. NPDC051494]|uniref:hypothetical protein n=1 Tax=Actinoplanes sp. NPDC051494 TaxID=3363907 RepID=UPI0037987AB5
MTVETEVAEAPEQGPRPPRRGADLAIRIVGAVLAVAAALLTATLELFLSTLRVGGVLIWVSVLLAAVANWALAWFATGTVARGWAVGLPWAAWTLVMFTAAGTRTAEGDYLVAGDDWVALGTILVGSLTFAVYVYRGIVRGPSVTKS